MSAINVWARFLVHEKLDAADCSDEDIEKLVRVAAELAVRNPEPKPFRMHKDRIDCRKLVCQTAMDLGIDLLAITNHRGKRVIGRGLLDVWNAEYAKRFGSTVGTAGAHEAIRRDSRTRSGT